MTCCAYWPAPTQAPDQNDPLNIPRTNRNIMAGVCTAAAALLAVSTAQADLDLSRAGIQYLDNGLTLIVLEVPELPVVSVQMLYKVGARNEISGKTGLAHFLEHMAFRSSHNFPDTDLVSKIYAVGGEWHGYTWIDQTTFFATVPVASLDLLLRIEADRLQRLTIAEGDVEAERGSVLGELRGYLDDPATTLYDHVAFAAFVAHPYRNNTIGFEHDVEQITHADLMAFYRQHYQPANAVLVVAGQVRADAIARRVRELFGSAPRRTGTGLPQASEPPQNGMRRVELRDGANREHFLIAYHAPPARAPDYPAMLLLQTLLGAPAGTNFRNNFGGMPVTADSPLAGLADGLRLWLPASADPYLFTISGSVAPGTDHTALEEKIEAVIAALRDEERTIDELAAARSKALDALVFDVQTTEDAAHQLAFFAGIEALDHLLELPAQLEAIDSSAVRRTANRYLRPEQRTIGWSGASPAPELELAPGHQEVTPLAPRTACHAVTRQAPGVAQEHHLTSGLPVLIQRSALTPTVQLRLIFAGSPPGITGISGAIAADVPWRGHYSQHWQGRAEQLQSLITAAAATLSNQPVEASARTSTNQTSASALQQLENRISSLLGEQNSSHAINSPLALALAGDFDQTQALSWLETAFGTVQPNTPPHPRLANDIDSHIEVQSYPGGGQSALGYLARGPASDSDGALAWQFALYVLSHGYEGRLGKEVISNRGLVYDLDANYEIYDGRAWVVLTTSVDTAKLTALETALQRQLEALNSNPPSAAELSEARQHFLGRRVTAAISNAELTARMAGEWMAVGHLQTDEDYRNAVMAVSASDVERVLPAFTAGKIIRVEAH